MLCVSVHHAVAFKIYDLNDTGVIEKDEVKRLLVALLQDNPAIDLTEDEIEAIVEQVLRMLHSCTSECRPYLSLTPLDAQYALLVVLFL